MQTDYVMFHFRTLKQKQAVQATREGNDRRSSMGPKVQGQNMCAKTAIISGHVKTQDI